MPYLMMLKPTVAVHVKGDDLLLVGRNRQVMRLRKPGTELKSLLTHLTAGGMTQGQLIETAAGDELDADFARLYYVLASFEKKGFICYGLESGGRPWMTLEPISPAFCFTAEDEKDAANGIASSQWRLSRFACLRREADVMIVESPLGHARLVLHDSRLCALTGLLAMPHGLEELAAALPMFDRSLIQAALVLLRQAGLVFPCDAQGIIGEETDPHLRLWEFHDLLFHSRSRAGRHENAMGPTLRFKDVLPPAAALKAPMSDRRTALYRPAAESVGPDFFAVLEARRSRRMPAETPMTLVQLGEFLWRTARVQAHIPADLSHPDSYEATLRPYPSGGATHELELYLTVTRCTGLEAGLYHYDPQAHELERLSALGELQHSLVQGAMNASALTQPPDVLITLAARFGRATWRYEGLAYALMQKHAGCLYQQMYLVATALGLAACGLGAGDSDIFAAATGNDYFAETSVGEFMLSAA